MTRHPSSMLNWFPIIEQLDIPTPRTKIVSVNREAILARLNGEHSISLDEFKTYCRPFGYPLFIRTDLSSAKHHWGSTCFVQDESKLENNILSVCAYQESKVFKDGGVVYIAGQMNYEALVIREFLKLDIAFYAHDGMPVNRERRYFIDGGRVVCHHPYWPDSAIKSPSTPLWREKLKGLNYEDGVEVELLTHYAEIVGSLLPEFWSVDFARGQNGLWYLIDMARGEQSYHWPHEKIT